MSLKKAFVTMRDNYVINQVARLKLPQFDDAAAVRYRIIFSGRVQHVGFRLEVCELAARLQLTGYCKNLENGDVLVEIQGPEDRISYLISFMESLKRISIKNRTTEKLELNMEEQQFLKQE